jgi:hypothetical protein
MRMNIISDSLNFTSTATVTTTITTTNINNNIKSYVFFSISAIEKEERRQPVM